MLTGRSLRDAGREVCIPPSALVAFVTCTKIGKDENSLCPARPCPPLDRCKAELVCARHRPPIHPLPPPHPPTPLRSVLRTRSSASIDFPLFRGVPEGKERALLLSAQSASAGGGGCCRLVPGLPGQRQKLGELCLERWAGGCLSGGGVGCRGQPGGAMRPSRGLGGRWPVGLH